MSANVARLTIFAIISALEKDGRSLISSMVPEGVLDAALHKELHEKVVERSRKDQSAATDDALVDLLEYTDLGDVSQILRRAAKAHPLPQALPGFCDALDLLVPTRNRVMHNRPLAAEDLPNAARALESVLALAELSLPESTALKKHLSDDSSFVLNIDLIPEDDRCRHNLPAPDYDDTTLIGRTSETQQIIRLLKGAYPVISIVGEGGVGKSALALESLYQLLDDPSNPFENIVWVSLKQRLFGRGGVREIVGAIGSTVSMLDAITHRLMATPDQSTIKTVLEYLEKFPTLLVIDNLETINVAEIRELLQGLPEHSKILTTSRIGIGEFEYRKALEPLRPAAGAELMRRVAQLLSVRDLLASNNERLQALAERLFCNPLAIRWFVAAMANGTTVSIVAGKKEGLLEYCFRDVYEKLPESAHVLISLMQVAKRPLTAGEISFLLEDSGTDHAGALNTLLSTSIVRVITDRSTNRTKYALGEFAGEYVREYRPLPKEIYSGFVKRLERLRVLEEKNFQEISGYELDPRTISPDPNNPDEIIAAAYLRNALSLSRNDHKAALALVEKAKGTAPDYSDVYKISAFIYASFGEISNADDQYQFAFKLNGNDPMILTLYAKFLMSTDSRLDLALSCISQVLESVTTPHAEMYVIRGRLLMYRKQYAEALEDFDRALTSKVGSSVKNVRISYNLACTTCRRAAEEVFFTDRPASAKFLARGLSYLIEAWNADRYDARLGGTARQLFLTALELSRDKAWLTQIRTLVTQLVAKSEILSVANHAAVAALLGYGSKLYSEVDAALSKRLAILRDQFEHTAGPFNNLKQSGLQGIVERLMKSGGFIRGDDGAGYHFKAEDLRNAVFPELAGGERVLFHGSDGPRGPVAKSIYVMSA